MELLTKTVYSLVYPETETVVSKLWASNPQGLYQKAYTGHQDSIHLEFLSLYQQWIKPQVTLPSFPYSYPCNGSSEAIRESLAAYASHNPNGKIHVFKGEYEGYEALATGYGLKTVRHERESWKNLLFLTPGEPFYLSQPSSLDGCYWTEAEEFFQFMTTNNPNTPVRVDICYVGATTVAKKVNLNYPNIDMVFFSLSKVFGVYYHRIGGVFSRQPMPGLTGNIWFKNVFSLTLGKLLLETFEPNELPEKYHNHQQTIVSRLNDRGLNFTSSDVLMLAYHRRSGDCFFKRENISRACITPVLDQLIRGENIDWQTIAKYK